MAEGVQLLVDGVRYGGWTDIDIRLSVEQLANTFELRVVERLEVPIEAGKIAVDSQCQVMIDGIPVISGYVDSVDPSYDANRHSVSISGRDDTCDLVDCSAVHPGGQFIGQNLLQIATALCRPFGIRVRATTPVGAAFPAWQVQPGETVNDNLQRAARQRGVMLIADGLGGLVIARAGRSRFPGGGIKRGNNIVSASGSRSHRDRYSEYRVIGQQPDSDDNGFGDLASNVSAVVRDRGVRRHRPLVVMAEDNLSTASALERGEWERNTRAGRAVSAAFTLAAWRHAGHLWRPDALVEVVDPELRIDDTLYISAVNYLLDDRGEKAIVSVTMPAAFDLIALPEPTEEPLQ